MISKRYQVQKGGGTEMADYKAMYLDAMERAIETLTAARQRCEDLYVATSGESARPAEETDDA